MLFVLQVAATRLNTIIILCSNLVHNWISCGLQHDNHKPKAASRKFTHYSFCTGKPTSPCLLQPEIASLTRRPDIIDKVLQPVVCLIAFSHTLGLNDIHRTNQILDLVSDCFTIMRYLRGALMMSKLDARFDIY